MEQLQKPVVRCSVIVLNFNGRDFLVDCLDSLNRQSFSNFETVVVDNGSSDGSITLVRERYPQVQVLALDKNYGFSIANNVALQRTLAQGTEYALLLNNDTVVSPNFVEEMVEVLEGDFMVGAACPKIYFVNQPETFWYAGGDFSLWTARARHRGWRKTDIGQFDDQHAITLATGCALIVRCGALRQVGLLDEQLWAYLEDVEWSVRFLEKGYRIAFASKACVWHHDGGTSVRLLGAGSQVRRQYLSTRNMILLARKHARWWQLPSYCGGFFVNHIAFYTALRLWRRDFKALLAIYQGLWDGLRLRHVRSGWKSGASAGQVLPVRH
jgi:GT2 family glycosyltransferase